MTHILMIAAENGALAGGKIGGIGDVVRDVPVALAKHGCSVTVLTPAYGSFNALPGAQKINSLKTSFAGTLQIFDLYELPSRVAGVRHIVVDHPLFASCGAGRIYCSDPPNRPFATDASKFALLGATAAESIVRSAFGKVDVIHLHDWHAAFLLILRHYDPSYRELQKIHCAYTIHNLSIQGIRPISKDLSSLQSWFPELRFDLRKLADPRWLDCINPMAIAIRLADRVHAVSPSYAEEILSPSDISGRGLYGGEGLEADLREADRQGRLFGILNGCEYTQKKKPVINNWKALSKRMQQQILIWASLGPTLASTHFIAQTRLSQLSAKRPAMVITSVGRITGQKVGLMRQLTSSARPALDEMLELLGDAGLFIMVGSGESDDEEFLIRTAARFDNFIFLRGYSEEIGDALYHLGDLFFMPSSFEPCGISQMLALRAGQPCLVHHVGGLRDTVQDNKTGFTFTGENPTAQADNLVATVRRALTLFQDYPEKWKVMRKAAAAARFDWANSIESYLKYLYK